MNRLDTLTHAPPTDAPSPVADYSSDFVLWLTEQARTMRARRFDLLDIENLCEEIEGIVRKEHRELKSGLKVVLVHLLKCKFQPEQRSSNWVGTLEEQRDQIAAILEDSPSLAPHVMEYADAVYPRAAVIAARETGLVITNFPSSNPFSQAELLDPDFIP